MLAVRALRGEHSCCALQLRLTCRWMFALKLSTLSRPALGTKLMVRSSFFRLSHRCKFWIFVMLFTARFRYSSSWRLWASQGPGQSRQAVVTSCALQTFVSMLC